MKFVLLGTVGFLMLTGIILVVVGWLAPDSALEPPHPPRCDCLACGRKMVDRVLKNHEATAKREQWAAKTKNEGR